MKLNKILIGILFLISIHIFYNYTGIYNHLKKRPCSVHHWAQCERASIALNYYQGGMNFFKPQIHKELDGEGITGLEFPFVNYSAAILYKIFGFHEIYYKLFVLLTLVIGLLSFYFLCFSFTNNYLLSVTAVMAAFASPVLLYYSANFLSDTTSLGFVLTAWFFFFRYINTTNKKYFYVFFVFAALAALVKITSLIAFGVVIALVILDSLKFFASARKGIPLITNRALVLCFSFLAIVLVFAWYKYAAWLSEKYHSDAFLLSQKIVTDKKEALAIWEFIKQNWINDYYCEGTYKLILGIAAALALGFRYVNRLLFTITLLTFLGSCCFVFLLFFQFRNHDYYIITLLPAIFFLLLTFIDMVARLANDYFPPLKTLVFLLLLLNIKGAAAHCKEVYMYRHGTAILNMVGDFSRYENLEGALRKLGVKPTDITLSAFDNTYCNSLYLMNQRGWTLDYAAGKEWYDFFLKQRNIQYLVLSDSALFNKNYPNDFKEKIIGQHNGLLIYKLK